MSSEVVAFPDAEAVAVAWLAGKLGAGVDTATKVPNPRPPAGVCRVRRTGGPGRIDLVTDDAQLTFECWAATEGAASDIARLAHAHMHAAAGETVAGAFIRKVTDIGGPSNFPDPESDSPRYQFTVGVRLRGDAI
jgi:hypothetical protein